MYDVHNNNSLTLYALRVLDHRLKSSNQQYYIGLDHIRAVAAYLVFCWHFIHSSQGTPVPFTYQAQVPLVSLVNEGHIGVSIFMVLSGYLFAKILYNRRIKYPYFYLNRFLRLAPLMIFVVMINALIRYSNGDPAIWYFFSSLVNGLVYPSLPNAGWSITVEFHFYLLLPLLLWFSHNSTYRLLILLIVAILARLFLFQQDGSVQYLAYWTIIGRVDLFIFGIIGFHQAARLQSSIIPVILSIVAIASFYWLFDAFGGYKGTQDSIIWVCMSTLEGLCLMAIIAFYDRYSSGLKGRFSQAIANIGRYSYSMYLLHGFFVFHAASFIHTRAVDLSNFYMAWLFATIAFITFVPITYLSYHIVEKTFLRFRVNYITT